MLIRLYILLLRFWMIRLCDGLTQLAFTNRPSRVQHVNLHRFKHYTITKRNAQSDHRDSYLSPSQNCTIDQVSPTAMAYIGDVVFELFARSRYVWPAKRTTDLQNIVVHLVRAETQSSLLEHIISGFHLTLQEQLILKRGRNSASARKSYPKRLIANSSSYALNNSLTGVSIYQDATAFEALLGFLYMTNTTRCDELLQFIEQELNRRDQLHE